MTSGAVAVPTNSTGTGMPQIEKVADDPCGCANGGTCTILDGQMLCECPTGFVGDRCEETFIDFSYGNNPGSRLGSDFIIGIAVACLALIVLIISGFVVWRRCTRLKEKRRWVKWQETRRQSKATIEGFTIVEPTPTEAKPQSTFGIQLFKNINCNKVFTFRHESTPKDVESQKAQREPDWIATICSERQNVLPAHSCGSTDSQISIVLNNDRISFLSYGPTYSKDSSAQTSAGHLSDASQEKNADTVSTCSGLLEKDDSENEKNAACKTSLTRISELPKNAMHQMNGLTKEEMDAQRAYHESTLKSQNNNNNRSGGRSRRLSFALPSNDAVQT